MARFPALLIVLTLLAGCTSGAPNNVLNAISTTPSSGSVAASPTPSPIPLPSPSPFASPPPASPSPSPSPSPVITARWLPLGPAGLSTTGTTFNGPFSGRVAAAAADPRDPNVVYVASEYTGIWKTTNFTASPPTWVPLTDTQTSMSVGCRCLAVAPSNPDIVYAAAAAPGGGILVSGDQGATFRMLAQSQFRAATFGGLAVDPTNSSLLYVAVQSGQATSGTGNDGGVYRSTDGGATWQNLTSQAHPSGFVSDVIVDPLQPTTLWAGFFGDSAGATNGVYRSVDGGQSWAQMRGPVIPFGAAVGPYVVVALSPTDDNMLYALVFDAALSPPSPHRYRTANALAAQPTWVMEAAAADPEDPRTNHQTLAVDPDSPLHVYGNGDDGPFVQSFNGGASWSNFFGEDPTGATFNGRGDGIFFGDRGVYLRPAGSNFAPAHQQGNLENVLFYDVEAAPGGFTQMLGVAQDQLQFLRYTGIPTWNYAGAGQEVGRIKYDPRNSGVVYAFSGESPPISFIKSLDNGLTWAAADSGIDLTAYGDDPKEVPAASQPAHNAFDMDPNDSNHLVIGTYPVYESKNGAASWTAISPSPLGTAGAFVQAIAFAPSDSRTIYAATSDGQLFLTRNGGTSWTAINAGLPTTSSPTPSQVVGVTQIVVDPANPQHAFVVLGSPGDLFVPLLFATGNGGQTWVDFSAPMPPLRVQTIAVDWAKSPLAIYAGTDRSLYASLDGGVSWVLYGSGLPNTIVRSIFLRDGRLVVGTYGRSAWWTSAF